MTVRKFSMDSKRMWRWFRWATVVIFLAFSILVLPTLVRKARLISHVDEVGGFFYSYHSPAVKKILGKKRYKLKAFIVPKLNPVLGRHWPGIFKEITHVEIDLRNGGSEWDLGFLKHVKTVQWVDIERLPVENTDVQILETLPSLTKLCINIENLSVDGISTLAGLKNLETLYLKGRAPTEEEVIALSLSKSIDMIALQKQRGEPATKAWAEAMIVLKERLPNCRIIYGTYFST